jgi:hypothetical protein
LLKELDGCALKHTGANTGEHVVFGARFNDDRVDTLGAEQV